MKINVDAVGKSAEVDAQGGMVLRGTGAGDFYANLTTNVPGAAPVDVVMVKRGARAADDPERRQTRTVPLPANLKPSTAAGRSTSTRSLRTSRTSRCRRSTSTGAPRTRWSARSTAMRCSANLPGLSKGLLSNLGASLGDIKVSLFIPRDTHLVETALIDMTMHVAKQSAHMSMSFAVTGVNQPVPFPQ